MKKMISIASAALLALSMSTTAFAADLNVTVDGTPVVWTDTKPFIDENSRTLVPLRPIANALGLTVDWNDDTNTAAFTDGITTVEFIVDSPEYRVYMNGYGIYAYTEMDTKAVIKDSRIYAPVRYLAESFQYDVGWYEPTKSITITKAADEIYEDDKPILPEIPASEKAAATPLVTDAGLSGTAIIALTGLVEDPDIFEYDAVTDTPVDCFSRGMQYEFEDGYIIADQQPYMHVAPGTYPITWILPGGWFEDGRPVIVSSTITVNKPTAKTALELALYELDCTLYIEEGADAETINTSAHDSISWLFDKTPFHVSIENGSMVQDEFGNNLWNCTVKVTDTETGAVVFDTLEIPLEYDSFDW